jgi:hypothetical protein
MLPLVNVNKTKERMINVMKRSTRHIVLLVLIVSIIATMFIDCVSAATTHSFWLSLPANGVTDLATPRVKE